MCEAFRREKNSKIRELFAEILSNRISFVFGGCLYSISRKIERVADKKYESIRK